MKKSICGIYKITNQVNGKVYIGQSIHIEQRWKEHKKKPFLEDSEEYNYPLYQAIRKYGLENFTFEVVEECIPEDLNQKEIDYIALYESYPPSKDKGYNQTPGGSRGIFEKKISYDQLLEIIDLLKNTQIPKKEIAFKYSVTEQAISAFNLGVERCLEGIDYPIRKKIIKKIAPNYCPICGKEIWKESNFCMHCSSKNKRIPPPPKKQLLKDLYQLRTNIKVAKKYKVSTVLIKKWKEEYNLSASRKDIDNLYEEYFCISPKKRIYLKQWGDILQINIETGEILNTFKSAAEACRFLGKNERNTEPIRKCAKGELSQAYGFKWKYLIEN